MAEQHEKRCPIEAQSAAIARAMASICNDKRARFGVMSGHDRKTLRLSTRCCSRCRAGRCRHRRRRATPSGGRSGPNSARRWRRPAWRWPRCRAVPSGLRRCWRPSTAGWRPSWPAARRLDLCHDTGATQRASPEAARRAPSAQSPRQDRQRQQARQPRRQLPRQQPRQQGPRPRPPGPRPVRHRRLSACTQANTPSNSPTGRP